MPKNQRFIYKVNIYSNLDLIFDNKKSNNFEVENRYNLKFSKIEKKKENTKIEEVELKIKREKSKIRDSKKELMYLSKKIISLQERAKKTSDLFDLNEIKKDLIYFNRKKENFKTYKSLELAILESELKRLINEKSEEDLKMFGEIICYND